MIVLHATAQRIFHRPGIPAYRLGVITVAPGFAVDEVLQNIRETLPPDVLAYTRMDMIEKDEHYFVTVKSLGIIFLAGVLVAFISGAVVLFQVLSTEMIHRMHEFATLKAIGYKSSDIVKIGLQQAAIFTLFVYIPAVFLAIIVYQKAYELSRIPISMSIERAISVLGLACVMCGIAAVFALGRVRKSDPVLLFR